MKDEELISAYIQLRDRRAQRKAAFEADDNPDKGFMDKIEAKLLARLNDAGLTSFSCRGVGTAYTKMKTSITAADKQVYLDFIKKQELWHLLEIRPMKTAVEEYLEQNQELPPGVNMRREIAVHVERN